MATRKMSENSLKNLEKNEGQFANCSEIARKAQKKSVQKRKENKSYREVAEKALLELINAGAMNSLTDIGEFKNLSTKDKIAILDHLRDSSGQKPVEKNLNVEGIKEDLEIFVDRKAMKEEIEQSRALEG